MSLCLGWDNDLGEGHHLFLSTDHGSDPLILRELQLGDPFEAFLEVGLYTGRVLGLREDLQQLIVGKEEEPMPWERMAHLMGKRNA